MTAPTVRLRWGGATDVGHVRSVNQDAMLLGPDVFVVADGMGGHQGGEVASSVAIETIEAVAGRIAGSSVTDLVAAVGDANEAVYERGSNDPSLSGMGTTLVAIAAVVEDGEERLAIVNVGDSRAYRFSGGELRQITEDHSLVAELVREGRISEQEAAVHPQRNIVTRALGIDEHIPVDDFQLLPHTGDRYLLCSDGLTNEVEERDMAVVLRTVDDPDEAARELVRRANQHGGRDNITVVIVDVVDDGGLSGRASAAVPGTVAGPESRVDDTQALLAVPDDQAHMAPVPGDTSADVTGRRPRAITLRSATFVLVVLALLGVGAFLINDYATGTYHVAIDDGEVRIFEGRPGGFLWFDPELVESTGIDQGDVPAEFLDDILGGVARPSLASARRYVANLERRIAELEPRTTTITTTSTTRTTAVPTTVGTP
jgi:serine/threonine protein phosphatase PrpC